MLCDAQDNIFVAGNNNVDINNYDFLAKLSYSSLPTFVSNTVTNSSFSVSPNPSPGIFQLSYCTSENCILTLKVLNTMGQVLYSEKIQSNLELHKTIDLSKEAKGVYLIELINEKGNEVKRVVIE
jgi:hypothetical protein